MALGDGFESQVMVFETNVGGSIELSFEEDGVFGADLDGLGLEELEELVAEANGEIVGDDAPGSE